MERRAGAPRAPGDPVPVVDTLPAPIDSTSFRAKGHIYQKMVDNVAKSVDGGMDRLLERVDIPEVRDFARQRFLGGAWYDALPMAPLSHAHARLIGQPLHPFARERGRIIAMYDVPGIYKALLRLFSPRTLVSRLPRVATFYFSFGGKALAEQLDDNRARTTLGNLPYTLAPMLAGVVEGFIAEALAQSGAKGVQVRTLDVCFDGNMVDDVATAVVRHESTWA
jgi:hypothetical protein